MPVREGEVSGEPDQIAGVGAEVGHDLDHLGGEDPQEEGLDEEGSVGGVSVEGGVD